jgi:hypothetical protein
MPRFTEIVTETTTIALGSAIDTSYYPKNATIRAHYRVTDFKIVAQASGQVTDVRLQSYNETTTVATDLMDAGECGVSAGGSVSDPTWGSTRGDCQPLEDLRIYLGASGSITVNVGYELIGAA